MTQTIQIAADDAFSPVRALYSLTPAHVDQIVAGLSCLAAAWDIERNESCDGYLSLLINHTACDATIVVDRDQLGIHVSLLLCEQFHTSQRRYTTIRETISAIKTIAASPVVEPQRCIG